MAPFVAVSPPPEPAPPWSWTLLELGDHLTANQRLTLLARLRAIGYDVHEWGEVPQ